VLHASSRDLEKYNDLAKCLPLRFSGEMQKYSSGDTRTYVRRCYHTSLKQSCFFPWIRNRFDAENSVTPLIAHSRYASSPSLVNSSPIDHMYLARIHMMRQKIVRNFHVTIQTWILENSLFLIILFYFLLYISRNA